MLRTSTVSPGRRLRIGSRAGLHRPQETRERARA
jgi:hypothetical protein